jgi:hypothetical protein
LPAVETSRIKTAIWAGMAGIYTRSTRPGPDQISA